MEAREEGEPLGAVERHAYLARAKVRLEMAVQRAPHDPEILYGLAHTTASIEDPAPDGRVERHDEEAIALFLRIRAMDPDYEPSVIAGELGILYTRLERYAEASAEYERAIGYSLVGEGNSETAWLNLAEVTMLSGDVALAVRRYERAADSVARSR